MSKVSLTSVYADRVKPSQSKPNLDIVTTELPADIAKDAPEQAVEAEAEVGA